jgi:hypothetical protein
MGNSKGLTSKNVNIKIDAQYFNVQVRVQRKEGVGRGVTPSKGYRGNHFQAD